ncbi:hypothetical protein V6Z11_A02G107500 [Gossypium hirsutum]
MARCMSSLSTSMPQRTFFSTAVEEKYNTNISNQPFCMEKCFLFLDAAFVGYTKVISSVVEKHGWKLFCLHLDDVLTKVVKEFYAHLTSLDNAVIYVHGASVLFNEYSINAYYGLPEGHDECSQFFKTITVEGLNQVFEDLCLKGTKWTVSRNDCYTIDHVSLKPHCRAF